MMSLREFLYLIPDSKIAFLDSHQNHLNIYPLDTLFSDYYHKAKIIYGLNTILETAEGCNNQTLALKMLSFPREQCMAEQIKSFIIDKKAEKNTIVIINWTNFAVIYH